MSKLLICHIVRVFQNKIGSGKRKSEIAVIEAQHTYGSSAIDNCSDSS